jgi:hypothetical protein
LDCCGGNHGTPFRPTRDRTRRGHTKVADRYSGDELDAALIAARRAIEFSLKEISDAASAGRAMFEAIDAARSILRNRA